MQRILTGDRPTGRLHIGHYFGSLKDRVRLQSTYDSFILIADVQALTDHYYEPQRVRDHVIEVAKDNLAVGIKPELFHYSPRFQHFRIDRPAWSFGNDKHHHCDIRTIGLHQLIQFVKSH